MTRTSTGGCLDHTQPLHATTAIARRACLRLLAGGASLAALLAATPGTRAQTRTASVVRLLSVVTPVDGELLPQLIPDFEQQTGYQVALATAEDVYGPARSGQADVVLSHYGHVDVDTFVLGGFGHWPRAVFSNVLALLGPPEDPAHVRGLTDLVEAFRRIGEAKAPFLVNDIEGVKYLSETLWNAAARPARQGWYLDPGPAKGPAIAAAADMSAYTIWGLTPFLKSQRQAPVALEPMVLSDPLLQRLMVTIVVAPQQVDGVNEAGGIAFQEYLLSPATQARMRTVRLPGIDQQVWWPAGRSNETSSLPH
jgi:tungstate transport system substrate-binding protein